MLQRHAANDGGDDKQGEDAAKLSSAEIKASKEEPAQPQSSLVFGYLNLFSDGVVCVSLFVFLPFSLTCSAKFFRYISCLT